MTSREVAFVLSDVMARLDTVQRLVVDAIGEGKVFRELSKAIEILKPVAEDFSPSMEDQFDDIGDWEDELGG